MPIIRKKTKKNPNGLVIGDIVVPIKGRKSSNYISLDRFKNCKLKIHNFTSYSEYINDDLICGVLEGSLKGCTYHMYANAFELYKKERSSYEIY